MGMKTSTISLSILAALILESGIVMAGGPAWTPVTNDQPSSVKPVIKSEVRRQGWTKDEDAADDNRKVAEEEKNADDNAYRDTVAGATADFNKSKKQRDELVAKFQSLSTEYEETLKGIQTIKATITNFDSQISRYTHDLQSRQKSLTDWLRTQKQGDAVVAAIYTVGMEETRQSYDARADMASMPLLAETMGTYVESMTTVFNNTVVRDFVKAVVEGTAKWSGDEPVRCIVGSGSEGTTYLRIKRYELYPFQAPDTQSAKGSASGNLKVMIIRTPSDLDRFLSKNDVVMKAADSSRALRLINDVVQGSKDAEKGLQEQAASFRADIAAIEKKIQAVKDQKIVQVDQLEKSQPQAEKLKAELGAMRVKKDDAERSMHTAQLALQEKKRVRESIIIVKNALAPVKSGQTAVDAIADTIADKLAEVKNDARTQHSNQTTVVVNNQLSQEGSDEAVTEAHIVGMKLLSALNDGESARVSMAFRVRTLLSDVVATDVTAQKKKRSGPTGPQDCAQAMQMTENIGKLSESDPAQAEQVLRKASDLCYASSALHYNLGTVLVRRQKYEDAQEAFQTALQLKPGYQKALDALAYLNTLPKSAAKKASRNGRKKPAQDCIKAAKLMEGISILIESDPQLAERTVQDAVDLCDSSVSLHYNFGAILTRLKKYDDARGELETALRLKPDYAKALYALASVHVISPDGDRVRAKQLVEKALLQEPKNQQYLNMLSMLVGTIDTPPKGTTSRPDAIAVVIGNRNYRSSVLPPVTYAINDASTVRQYLIDALGFNEKNIVEIDDASAIDLVKYFGNESDHRGILYNLVRKSKSDIFIYYSGHGAPDTNTKKAYILPVDTDPNIVKLTGYSLDVLYANLAKLNEDKEPKSITVVLDSCFSGGSNSGMIIPNASPIFVEHTKPQMSMSNAVVFTSSTGNQISSWYPEKNHGLFTYFFLKNIKEAVESNSKLSAEEMEKALQGPDGVNDYALRLFNRSQQPQVIGNKEIALVP